MSAQLLEEVGSLVEMAQLDASDAAGTAAAAAAAARSASPPQPSPLSFSASTAAEPVTAALSVAIPAAAKPQSRRGSVEDGARALQAQQRDQQEEQEEEEDRQRLQRKAVDDEADREEIGEEEDNEEDGDEEEELDEGQLRERKLEDLRRRASSRKLQAAWRAFSRKRRTTAALARTFVDTGVMKVRAAATLAPGGIEPRKCTLRYSSVVGVVAQTLQVGPASRSPSHSGAAAPLPASAAAAPAPPPAVVIGGVPASPPGGSVPRGADQFDAFARVVQSPATLRAAVALLRRLEARLTLRGGHQPSGAAGGANGHHHGHHHKQGAATAAGGGAEQRPEAAPPTGGSGRLRLGSGGGDKGAGGAHGDAHGAPPFLDPPAFSGCILERTPLRHETADAAQLCLRVQAP